MNTKTLTSCPSLPPHCPNPNCKYHKPQPHSWPFALFGTVSRKSPPYTVQRYLCLACGRTCSDQTFRTTYWLKRADLLPKVHKHAVSGAANRQIARLLDTSPTTVDNLLARLGRHCILFHRHLVSQASWRFDREHPEK